MSYYNQTCDKCGRVKPCMGGICDECYVTKDKRRQRARDQFARLILWFIGGLIAVTLAAVMAGGAE